MEIYGGQENDRKNWKKFIVYKEQLIIRVEELGLRIDNLQSMKISELEA